MLFVLMLLSADAVTSVSIQGSDIRLPLSTKAGRPFDAANVRSDVRKLYSTGRFEDVRVEAEGRSITFHVAPRKRLILRAARIEPAAFPLKMKMPVGGPVDRIQARRIAATFHKQIREHGYTNATVDAELIEIGSAQADLILHVRTADPVRVQKVHITGDRSVDKSQLKALRVRRILPPIPGLWGGWTTHPPYNTPALESDLARLRSAYIARGYFDASVRLDHTETVKGRAVVHIKVDPGPRTRQEFDARTLCRCLLDQRRESERAGILEFTARFQPSTGVSVEQGRPYTVRRIDIQGNRRISDTLVRRNILLDEGDLLDSTLLRKSLHKLNSSALFEPLNESHVDVITDPKRGVADLRIRLTEAKRGSWSLSGPVGPMSFAGPLRFTLASRLPPWGAGLLELSTYFVSLSFFAQGATTFSRPTVTPMLGIERPFVPGQAWTSGWSVMPQIGWQYTAIGYGASQLQGRVLPWLTSGPAPAPALPVSVERPGGDAVLLCEPDPPRLRWLRKTAGIAVQVAAAVPVW